MKVGQMLATLPVSDPNRGLCDAPVPLRYPRRAASGVSEALTKGVVVARGGVEPPTFRFSVA